MVGAGAVISKYHPVILVATHSNRLHHECIAFLEKLGYRVSGIDTPEVDSTDELVAYPIFRQDSDHGIKAADPDMFSMGYPLAGEDPLLARSIS